MIRPSLLVRWYGTVATIATLLAAQAIILPRRPPSPQPLPARALEAGLRRAGLLSATNPPVPTDQRRVHRSQDLVTSPLLILPLREDNELILMASSVRQRFNFQASFIGRAQPSGKLEDRQLIATPTPTSAGKSQGLPALQTCLVPADGLDNAFGVTRDQLTVYADHGSQGVGSAVERLIGLQPNRTYSCILITLRGSKGQPPSERLWEQVLRQIEPVLQQGDR